MLKACETMKNSLTVFVLWRRSHKRRCPCPPLTAELGLHKTAADQSDIYVIGHLLAKGNRHGEHGMLACDISRASHDGGRAALLVDSALPAGSTGSGVLADMAMGRSTDAIDPIRKSHWQATRRAPTLGIRRPPKPPHHGFQSDGFTPEALNRTRTLRSPVQGLATHRDAAVACRVHVAPSGDELFGIATNSSAQIVLILAAVGARPSGGGGKNHQDPAPKDHLFLAVEIISQRHEPREDTLLLWWLMSSAWRPSVPMVRSDRHRMNTVGSEKARDLD
jgi:hypothetical protein